MVDLTTLLNLKNFSLSEKVLNFENFCEGGEVGYSNPTPRFDFYHNLLFDC
jgi:hypothetical protein